MSKLWSFTLAAGLALAIGATLATPTPSADAWAGKACARTEFKTKLVKDACAKGGQKEAKKAMKEFVKVVKKAPDGDSGMTCETCHSKLGADYPLKKDGLSLFKKYEKLAK